MNLSVDSSNQQQLKKLVIAVKVNLQRTSLLLAVCDDINLRSQIVGQYEAMFQQIDLDTERVWIDRNRPSLHQSLVELNSTSLNLVVTVLGANELRTVPVTGAKLDNIENRSQQEDFFFSLQWTRESLLQFKHPIILWLTDSMATSLAKQSPDFWSWRGGLFEFQSTAESLSSIEDPEYSLLITEYQQLVSKLEQQNSHSPLLISFYNKIGEYYQTNGNLKQALHYYQLALELSEEHEDLQERLFALENLEKIGNSPISPINNFIP